MAGLWLIARLGRASRRTSIAMLLAYAGGNPAAAAPSKLRPQAEVDGSEAGRSALWNSATGKTL
jgi:hypothetical protein